MLEIANIYRMKVYHELTTTSKDEVLNPVMVEEKALSFLTELGNVGEESKAYTFYDKSAVDKDALLETYINGLKMLMAIGYEIKVDEIKDNIEIGNEESINHQFMKIYQEVILLNSTYRFNDYQNCIDDYLALGLKLNLDLEDILNSLKDSYK
ncbi:MAG: dUTP diphosphatase [Thomasclavelia sp.]|nr:dUTP diphosphatase [Thomasclavelia sp.]